MSRRLHQVVVAAVPGDAITNHALTLRAWLRELGFQSELFAWHIHPEMEGEVKPFSSFRSSRSEKLLIFHHSIGSPLVEHVMALPLKLVLIYHNITPAAFFRTADPAWTAQLTQGRSQLNQLRAQTLLGLGVSGFNMEELHRVGYAETGILPLVLETSQYDLASNDTLTAQLQAERPLLLFVGRLAPNKKQEDLIKLLYHLCRILPTARIALVGQHWLPDYTAWLKDMIRRMKLDQHVLLAGRVSQRDMITYYRTADLFVSMSEHEGFCMPLIESMYLGLPILAYESTAVPSTLGGAGIMFRDKNFAALAELIALILPDEALLERLVKRQRERAMTFLAPRVKEQFVSHLQRADMLSSQAE